MPFRRRTTWYRPQQGNVLDGVGFTFTVPVRLRARVNNVTVSSVIVGLYCVEAGSIFAPGPDIGDTQSDQGPGQVNC